MSGEKTYAIIGGDARNIYLANALIKDGHSVMVYAMERQMLESKAKPMTDFRNQIIQADYIVFPMPMLQDNDKLNSPFSNTSHHIEELLDLIPAYKLVLGGAIENWIYEKANTNKLRVIDYLKRGELAVLNSIPTAEGAIQIAMEELPITVHGCNCLILGYGNIGKTLSLKMKALGAHVTVSARTAYDIAQINVLGYKSVDTYHVSDIIGDFDLIINTIPSRVLGHREIESSNTSALIIDLASKPGGIDFNKAQELSRRVVWALSLPGKVAPVTTANAVKETIYNILREEE